MVVGWFDGGGGGGKGGVRGEECLRVLVSCFLCCSIALGVSFLGVSPCGV